MGDKCLVPRHLHPLDDGSLQLENKDRARRVKRQAYRYRIDEMGGLLFRDADNVEKRCAM